MATDHTALFNEVFNVETGQITLNNDLYNRLEQAFIELGAIKDAAADYVKLAESIRNPPNPNIVLDVHESIAAYQHLKELVYE